MLYGVFTQKQERGPKTHKRLFTQKHNPGPEIASIHSLVIEKKIRLGVTQKHDVARNRTRESERERRERERERERERRERERERGEREKRETIFCILPTFTLPPPCECAQPQGSGLKCSGSPRDPRSCDHPADTLFSKYPPCQYHTRHRTARSAVQSL